MKLLSSPLSPFAARVRLAIHAKSLPVEVAPANMWTSAGTKSPEYLAVNPIGKVPTLILDDGSSLPESDTIVEFLADAFPRAGLRPADPQAAARGRLLARVLELYVMSPVWGALFGQAFAPNKDAAAVEAAVQKAEEGLRHLEHFMPEGVRCAVSEDITTADCALVPMLSFQGTLVRACGGVDPLAKFPRLADYMRRMRELPAVQKLLTEMREGLVGTRLAFLLEHVQ